jgi:glutathione S-transferase
MNLLDQPAVRVFAFWYLILVIKMQVLIFRTSRARLGSSVYASPEDYAAVGLSAPATPQVDQGIERLRRALQNDLENILPFFGVGLIYALSGPSLLVARLLFGGFALARIAHSVFYVRGRQPHRSIAFIAGMVLLSWMLFVALWRVL